MDPYLQPGETGAIIVSGGQIISNKGANVENLATVEVLREDGTRWCTLPSLPYTRHEYSEQGLSYVHMFIFHIFSHISSHVNAGMSTPSLVCGPAVGTVAPVTGPPTPAPPSPRGHGSPSTPRNSPSSCPKNEIRNSGL